MPQSVESPIGLPPVELPARFRASWAVQSAHALFGGLRRAWRWIELRRQRPQQDKPNSHARQCCSTAGDGSEGEPRRSPQKQVEDGTSSSTLKTALDYLVREQQVAESGADSESRINVRPKNRIISKSSSVRTWHLEPIASRSNLRDRSVLRLNIRQTVKNSGVAAKLCDGFSMIFGVLPTTSQ
jgi:hypothetical protein